MAIELYQAIEAVKEEKGLYGVLHDSVFRFYPVSVTVYSDFNPLVKDAIGTEFVLSEVYNCYDDARKAWSIEKAGW